MLFRHPTNGIARLGRPVASQLASAVPPVGAPVDGFPLELLVVRTKVGQFHGAAVEAEALGADAAQLAKVAVVDGQRTAVRHQVAEGQRIL
jgi:hypothetical protein